MRMALSVFAAAVVLSAGVSAEARKPEDVFGGKIMTSNSAYPVSAKSAEKYITAVKKQQAASFQEDKEEKQWKIYYAAFFKKPLNDLEVTVNLFDVTGGGERMVESYQQFLTKRGERVVIGSVKLNRSDDGNGYPPNSTILMRMETNGKVIASATFRIAGEAKVYKGKVEFSDEEARGGEIKNDEEPPPPEEKKPAKTTKPATKSKGK